MVVAPMATPGTEACDAVGVALGPQWREWPVRQCGEPIYVGPIK